MNKCKLTGLAGALITFLACPVEGWAAQWVTNVTPVEAIVGNSGGEYVQILTGSAVLNPGGCATADSYIVHDAAVVRSALAIALSAIAAGRQIRVFVTDSCDAATGRPLVSAIGLM